MMHKTEDFLTHHGIKGMHWGIRNDKNSALYLAKQKYQFISKFDNNGNNDNNGKYVGLIALGAASVALALYSENPAALKTEAKILFSVGGRISEKKFLTNVYKSQLKVWQNPHTRLGLGHIQKSFVNEGFVIPKGTIIHRFSTKKEEQIGRFISINERDFNRYVVAFKHEKNITYSPENQAFHIKAQHIEDIKIPSTQHVVDTFNKIFEEKHPAPTIFDRRREYQKVISGHDFVKSDFGKRLITELQKDGYGGILDEMDAGVIADKPIYLFDTSKISVIKTDVIDNQKFKEMKTSLFELEKRKGI